MPTLWGVDTGGMDGRQASSSAEAADRLPRRGLRHSAASERASTSHGSRLSLLVAFVANLFVAAAKLAAGLITGSAALLAEAAHSLADSNNEVLLAVSFRRARRAADAEHPFGYGGVRFIWAFLAAIASFLIGGCLSVGLAINDLVHGNVVDDYLVAWIVLGIAFLADGASLVQTMRQARREAALWGQPTIRFLRHTSDPTLRALAVEDSAALIGLALAAGGLAVHELGGPASSDAIASLLIGILLGATAVGLARPLADLLIGRSVRPERLELARRILASSPAVEEVRQVYAVHVAPQEAVVAAKVHPSPHLSVDELAQEMDRLDARLRGSLPEVGEVFIDLTQHSSRDSRG
jgi:cation diffusion facilitator family transporter